MAISRAVPISHMALKPLAEFLRKEQGKISVGSAPKHFIINEELICDRSQYFENTFRGGFKEPEGKNTRLDGDEPGIFGKVIEWIYTLNYDCGFENFELQSESFYDSHQLNKSKLHIFTDKLFLPTLAGKVLRSYEN